MPTQGVTETIEIWVSFVIEKHGINALSFCTEAVNSTKRLVEDMSTEFGL